MIISIDAKNICLQNLTSIPDKLLIKKMLIGVLNVIKMYTLRSQSQHVFTVYTSRKIKDSIWIYNFVKNKKNTKEYI